MTPCRPKHPRQQCNDCQRHDRSIPHDPEQRTTTLLLDVRAILNHAADCQLFVEVPEPVYWWERDEAEEREGQAA